jgi:transcription elongation factor Elf1
MNKKKESAETFFKCPKCNGDDIVPVAFYSKIEH